jgi:hypothetical protein
VEENSSKGVGSGCWPLLGLRLGRQPTIISKSFRLGRFLLKPNSKKQIEVTGLGLHTDSVANLEFSTGLGLQQVFYDRR